MKEAGTSPIPTALLDSAAVGDPNVAHLVAERLLDAVSHRDEDLDIVRLCQEGDVRSFRIDVKGSRYHATITENAVVERYSVERLRSAARRRAAQRPTLIELMHVFTVHDDEGALVSASDSVPVGGPQQESVFGQLFDAARAASTEAEVASARAR